ncbi:MAG: YibE/F family protein [Clostridia bacterium]|nr:YibE/F family protein [Clostridia bacterium]
MRAKNRSDNRLAIWIITVVLSAVLLFAGNRIVTRNVSIMDHPEASAKAKVTELGELVEETLDGINFSARTQYFTAKILSGENKGKTVEAHQQIDSYLDTGERFVKVGDKVILLNYGAVYDTEEWVFGNYARSEYIFVLGALFLLLLVIFGRGKGLNTVLSLVFTCLAVFCVFIPGVLSGFNIYLLTILICVFTIVMTLILTNGISAKSVATMLGCGAGVLAAALITLISDRIMHLTGFIDEHSVYLQVLGENSNPINLRALIFAMITIGAMGALMDVAMDMASSLFEVKRHAPSISDKELFKSGMNIGRDVMGTMANTLVLAYIGSSLCTILLRITYSNSLMEMINTESIVVELLNAIVGSLGILLTMPLTALVCVVMYRGRHTQHGR